MQNSSTDFNNPHDLCIKDYSTNNSLVKDYHHSSSLKYVNKKENNVNQDFNGSSSSLDDHHLDDGERQTPEPNQQVSSGDRLIQLIVKGILYENCVNYCEQIATSNTYNSFNSTKDNNEVVDDEEDEKIVNSNKTAVLLSHNQVDFSNILNAVDNGKVDLKLLTWLTSLPKENFNYFFDNDNPFNLQIEQHEKPVLVANWSETILSTPIKPKVFPHFATPFTKMTISNAPATVNPATVNNTLQQQTTNNPLSSSLNSQHQQNQQLASLISNLSNGSNIGSLLNIINQMTQNSNASSNGFNHQTTNSNNLKQLYDTMLIEDLAKTSINLSESSALNDSTVENGAGVIPKLDFLARNFSQLTSLNDLTNVNSNLFNLTNANTTAAGLNSGSNSNQSHHNSSVVTNSTVANDLVSSLNKNQLNSLLQSNNLSSLFNGANSSSLNDLTQALNGQSGDDVALDRTNTSLLLNNQKLSAKVQKDFWKKMHVKKKLIDDNPHLVVCNNVNKLNHHTFGTNQLSLFDEDLCKTTGKRAKQYKKRDNPVSILSYLFSSLNNLKVPILINLISFYF